MKPVLLMMLGYPGSGKSYFAKKLAERGDFVRLNADSLRSRIYGGIEAGTAPEFKEALFGALDYAALEILRSGHPVIYDAQHRRREDRQHSMAIADEANTPAVVVWVKTPIDVAVERVSSREQAHDQQRMSRIDAEARVKKAESLFEEFVDNEMVIDIDGTAEFPKQYAQLMNGLARVIS